MDLVGDPVWDRLGKLGEPLGDTVVYLSCLASGETLAVANTEQDASIFTLLAVVVVYLISALASSFTRLDEEPSSDIHAR